MSLVQLLEDAERIVRNEINSQFPPSPDWHRGGYVRLGTDGKYYVELYKKNLTNVNSPQENHTYEIDLNDPNTPQTIKSEIGNFFK